MEQRNQQGDGHQFEPAAACGPPCTRASKQNCSESGTTPAQGAAFHTDEVEPVTALFGDLFQSYVQDALCDGHFVHSAPMLAQSPGA